MKEAGEKAGEVVGSSIERGDNGTTTGDGLVNLREDIEKAKVRGIMGGGRRGRGGRGDRGTMEKNKLASGTRDKRREKFAKARKTERKIVETKEGVIIRNRRVSRSVGKVSKTEKMDSLSRKDGDAKLLVRRENTDRRVITEIKKRAERGR